MRYPGEVSKFKVKVIYIGRSTKRFVFNEIYEGTYVFGEERGWKSSSCDYLLLPDGYKITPYEEKRFFRWADGQTHKLLNIMYGRTSTRKLMQNLVYSKNPFLAMVKPDISPGTPFPIPVVQD